MQPSTAATRGGTQTLAAHAGVQEQLDALREQVAAHERALSAERQARADVEARFHALSARYADARAQNDNLAKQVIAATLLHASPEMAEVEQAIREVVINLIGSEEFAVVEVDGSGRLSVISTFGMDPDHARALPVAGELAEALATGEPRLRDDAGDERPDPIAVIPMFTGDRCGAAVVIWGLLTQKEGWVPFDHDLFSLLRTHGGAALYTSRLHRVEQKCRVPSAE